ncbi:BQ5605_C003g02480 [Microbotryum silenes-dioicae]|uniref:BQ5605_C003g02480 protein n=1 Tax=Microbotryum silenes-dioicae TaxID=796604 RepID=A0A2X0P4D0_9BASI|nr:BQ5605_C003g02480 [Microbotryum silenes-dioicae]
MATKDKKSKAKAKPPSPSQSASSSSASSSSSSSASSESESDSDSQQQPRPAAAAAVVGTHVVPSRSSKYTPPPGYKALRSSAVSTSAIPLDYDKLASSSAKNQIWLVRLPRGLKPSALDGQTLQLPSGSDATSDDFVSDEPLARFTKHSVPYSVHQVPSSSSAPSSVGSEMQHFVPIVPRGSKNGKLYQAPLPVSRQLYITRSTEPTHLPSLTHPHSEASSQASSLIASQPSPVPGALLTSSQLLQPPTSDEIQRLLSRKQRIVPEGIELKYRPILSGTRGIVGGKGTYHSAGVHLKKHLVHEDVEMQNDEKEAGEAHLEAHLQTATTRFDKDEGVEVKEGGMLDIVDQGQIESKKKRKGVDDQSKKNKKKKVSSG